jgi:hypothetical protein
MRYAKEAPTTSARRKRSTDNMCEAQKKTGMLRVQGAGSPRYPVWVREKNHSLGLLDHSILLIWMIVAMMMIMTIVMMP